MNKKYALIIGNTEYTDPGLAQLTAPGKDAEDFGRVLRDKEICGFDEVNILLNQPEHIVRGAIDEFFDAKKPDDLLILYFSGHGVRDEVGSLYLAVKNTVRNRLRSTAIKSDYIRETMEHSRSKRQVLILDCCNSGAFAQGTKAATGVSIGTASAFEAGYGRVILTASDSTQYAWEGDRVIGETDNSLFTHFLVEGLKGDADRDGDACITVDELYDYVYEKVRVATPNQTPSKFSTKQQGEIILRQNIPVEEIRPTSLPQDLTAAMNSSLLYVREGAVRQLDELLKGKNIALARSAREALKRIAEHDDSRQISRMASQALESSWQTELPDDQRVRQDHFIKQNVIEQLPRQVDTGFDRNAGNTPIRVTRQSSTASDQNHIIATNSKKVAYPKFLEATMDRLKSTKRRAFIASMIGAGVGFSLSVLIGAWRGSTSALLLTLVIVASVSVIWGLFGFVYYPNTNSYILTAILELIGLGVVIWMFPYYLTIIFFGSISGFILSTLISRLLHGLKTI